jgi:hypothetical protein
LQTGDPAFGTFFERRNIFGGELQPHHLVQESHRLFGREAQIGGSELRHLSPSAQAREQQGWVDAARNDEVDALRQVLQQERDDPVDGLGFDQVVVVEDYGDP